ncbi:hypothetical protein V6X63_01500 [Spiribacter sp. 221]
MIRHPSASRHPVYAVLALLSLMTLAGPLHADPQTGGSPPGGGSADAGPPTGDAVIDVIEPLVFGRYLSRIQPGTTGEISLQTDGSVSTRGLRPLDNASSPARVTVRETFPGQGQPFEGQYDLRIMTSPLEKSGSATTLRFSTLRVRFVEDRRGGSGGQVLKKEATGNGNLAVILEDVDLPSGNQPGNLKIAGDLELRHSATGTYEGVIFVEATQTYR